MEREIGGTEAERAGKNHLLNDNKWALHNRLFVLCPDADVRAVLDNSVTFRELSTLMSPKNRSKEPWTFVVCTRI